MARITIEIDTYELPDAEFISLLEELLVHGTDSKLRKALSPLEWSDLTKINEVVAAEIRQRTADEKDD